MWIMYYIFPPEHLSDLLQVVIIKTMHLCRVYCGIRDFLLHNLLRNILLLILGTFY